MDEILKNNGKAYNSKSENAYLSIQSYVINAQNQVYAAVNQAMVTAYWNIGKAFTMSVEKMIVLSMVNRSCNIYRIS